MLEPNNKVAGSGHKHRVRNDLRTVAGLGMDGAKLPLRPCVGRIMVDRTSGKLVLKLRAMPRVAGAPDAGELEMLEFALPG